MSDLSYGFFLIRNNNWVKNRYQYLSKYIAYKEIFVRVMQKVKNWTPEDFTIGQRRDYLTEFNVCISENDMDKYLKLTDLCINAWKNSDFADEIKRLSYSEIFMIITKGSTKYTGTDYASLKRWDNINDLNVDLINITSDNQNEETKTVLLINPNVTSHFNINDDKTESVNIDKNNISAIDEKNFSNHSIIEVSNAENNESFDPDFPDNSNHDMNPILDKDYDVKKCKLDLFVSNDNIKTDVVSNPITTEPIIVADSNVLDDFTEIYRFENNRIRFFIIEIFKNLRYKKFNPYILRNALCPKDRVDLKDLNVCLNDLCNLHILSVINEREFRFSIKNERKRYVTFLNLQDVLKTVFNIFVVCEKKVLSLLRTKLRCNAKKIRSLVDDLVSDNLLIIRHQPNSKEKYYSLNL